MGCRSAFLRVSELSSDLSGVQEIFGKTGNAEDSGEKRTLPLSPLVRIPVTSSTPASPSGRKEGIWGRARPQSSPGTLFNKCACPQAITGWSPTDAWKPVHRVHDVYQEQIIGVHAGEYPL
ncbi:hypothetical protein CEXT_91911 [Caerostris extrusa]|uniref:Uncharacterized protein n=1 Tax=Caerostris extrusa TaxID=172846 RepID=A0AAV4M4P9_CAEEX|nr:hypothetical protein CEXT_91911 [Caerostris extrusa]